MSEHLQVNESHQQSYENEVPGGPCFSLLARLSKLEPPPLSTTALEGPVAGRITWTVSGGRKQKLH